MIDRIKCLSEDMSIMLILGIDPGSRSAGHALIEVGGRKIKYLTSGVMKYGQTRNFIDRLGIIYKSCEDIILETRPDEIAIESLIYRKNISSLSKLAQARGAMIASFMQQHQGKVFEYAPNLVKSSVTGYGHSSKENIQRALALICGSLKFKTDDESDALAVAICHAMNRGNKLKGLI